MANLDTDTAVKGLGGAAAQIAMKAAAEYLHQHKLTAAPEALEGCLRSWCRIKFPEAMADAKAALDAHMDDIATQTFAATMALAGIEAAKEAGFPS